MLLAAAAVAVGALTAWGGWTLIKACAPREGQTRFVRLWSPVVLGTGLGQLLLLLGLILAFIFAPMAWIARPR